MRYGIRVISLFLLILCFFSLSLSYFFAWLGFPQDFHIIMGEEEMVEILFPFNYYLKTGDGLRINGQKIEQGLISLKPGQSFAIESRNLGEFNLEFLLFGLLPLHRMVVRVLPPIEVYPGGQSIGVLLNTEGVIIKQFYYVLDHQDKMLYPARDAGIEIGDRILEINGEVITSRYQVNKMITETGEEDGILRMTLEKRDGKVEQIQVIPVKDKKSDRYMIGIHLEDGAAGVGTLTFYDEDFQIFGALGHMVTDLFTNHRVNLRGGKIITADITGINLARRGLPGEKMGVFQEEPKVLGEVKENTPFGIFGELHQRPQYHVFQEPIPVATGIQIKTGEATVYTVLSGQEVESFTIEIQRVRHQGGPSAKGLVIKIIDERLLDKTGGIVQGMSGSPIIQDGRFVGAITHVFVNDPTRGYGVLAQWMIYESGLLEEKKVG